MKETHYEKAFEGIRILNLSYCKECNLPKITELNFWYGKNAHERVNLPLIPEFEEICDNDCA